MRSFSTDRWLQECEGEVAAGASVDPESVYALHASWSPARVGQAPAEGVDADEALLDRAAASAAMYVRFWSNHPCIVVGRGYARRLPRLVRRVADLPVLVRTSGGQVVVHGPGVLNTAVAIPRAWWDGSIDEVFHTFSIGITTGLQLLGVEAEIGEIEAAYCPGRYDVAVQGRKMVGTSQRRTRHALMVHGSINVAVDPTWLATTLEAFYEAVGVDTPVIASRIGSLHQWVPQVELLPVARAVLQGIVPAWAAQLGRPLRVVGDEPLSTN